MSRNLRAAPLVGGLVVAVAAAGLVGFNFIKERNAAIGVAKAWDIKGPPCPSLTAAEFAQKKYVAAKVFDYDGVQIGRHAGNVSCSDVKQDGGKGLFVDRVCQFTSPAVITVASKAGAFYFVPGVGQPATVAIHGGQARCVMASDYTLASPD